MIPNATEQARFRINTEYNKGMIVSVPSYILL